MRCYCGTAVLEEHKQVLRFALSTHTHMQALCFAYSTHAHRSGVTCPHFRWTWTDRRAGPEIALARQPSAAEGCKFEYVCVCVSVSCVCFYVCVCACVVCRDTCLPHTFKSWRVRVRSLASAEPMALRSAHSEPVGMDTWPNDTAQHSTVQHNTARHSTA